METTPIISPISPVKYGSTALPISTAIIATEMVTPVSASKTINDHSIVVIPISVDTSTTNENEIAMSVKSVGDHSEPTNNIPIPVINQDLVQKQENVKTITSTGLLDETKDLLRLFIELKAAASIRSKIYSWIGSIIMVITSIASLLGTSWFKNISSYLCLIITIVTHLSVILKIKDRSFNFGHIVIDCNICINRLTGLVAEINSGISAHNYDTFNKTLSVYKNRYNEDAGIEINTVDLGANAKVYTLQPLLSVSTS
jgi:hypothetical protein